MVVFQQQPYLRSFTQDLCILSSCSSSFLSLPPPLPKSGQQLTLGTERLSLSGDWLKIFTLSTPVTDSEGRGACLANHIKAELGKKAAFHLLAARGKRRRRHRR